MIVRALDPWGFLADTQKSIWGRSGFD